MRMQLSALTAVLIAVGPAPAAAQDHRDRLFVSVDWLAAHLNDPDLVILHVGPKDAYQAAHIAGARQVQLSSITAPSGPDALAVEFPADSTLERQLEDLGLSDRSRPVVVAAKDWGTSALRVFSTLYYAGLGDRAVVLDGGLEAWTAAGRPVTAEASPTARGSLTIRPRSGFVVDADFVRGHVDAKGWAVIDARGQAFYDGVRNSQFSRDDPGKPGHVPGALSLGVQEVWQEDGRFKSTAELRALFDAAGVRPGDVVVAYCHIGIYANSILTAARVLGHEVRLYDGSFQDWAKRDLPLTTEATRR